LQQFAAWLPTLFEFFRHEVRLSQACFNLPKVLKLTSVAVLRDRELATPSKLSRRSIDGSIAQAAEADIANDCQIDRLPVIKKQ
jgi:hypothetical protein